MLKKLALATFAAVILSATIIPTAQAMDNLRLLARMSHFQAENDDPPPPPPPPPPK